ncbi:MAG: dihydropteroate synthase [Helicobacteraceae bacterium]|jgi:dihydropteroate synthase|nr:dihydropteroate synthase [Helicobacteraceae bacterium]
MIQKLNSDYDFKAVLNAICCEERGIDIMLGKAGFSYFYISDLPCGAANILKQDALSLGAELAVHAGTPNCSVARTDALLFATQRQLEALIDKESRQPFGLRAIAAELKRFLDIERIRPKVMGIININNDSFNSSSRTAARDAAKRAEEMIDWGAEYIDIGAVSSRPGSDPIPPEDELDRLKPAIDEIYKTGIYQKAIFSLDSFEPLPIEYALEHGFRFINDITGGINKEILKLAKKFNAAICIMHMQGNQKNMQDNPHYTDVAHEVDGFFEERIRLAAEEGVDEIVLDAGIGFGKRKEHNLALIKAYSHFLRFGRELLIGASRKSLIGEISPSGVEDRLAGTIALHLKAVEYGASIIRCHDVYEHVQALKVCDALRAQNPK